MVRYFIFAVCFLAACGVPEEETLQNINQNNESGPTCGDGVVDPGEQCDEGSQNSDLAPNGCRSDCRSAYCGDNIIDAGEECERTNLAGSTCQTFGYSAGALSCDDCSFNVTSCSFCGDGIAEGTEAGTMGYETCDGSDLREQTCLSIGQAAGVLACGSCSWDISGCVGGGGPICGNGVVEDGEACDDGNTDACDGCNSSCQVEVCGNGTHDCGEECDDGNTSNEDSCLNSCSVASCGDGFLWPSQESCDDGNTDACDGCSSSCQVEACGNGTVECNESCDDGNFTPGDGCGPTCLVEVCGNGYLDPGELCEPALDPLCNPDCHTFCGDGITQTQFGEVCDYGANPHIRGCYADCSGRCGDGIIHDGSNDPDHGPDNGEECDGPVSPGFSCTDECLLDECGDGICGPSESPFNCITDCATGQFGSYCTVTADCLGTTTAFGPLECTYNSCSLPCTMGHDACTTIGGTCGVHTSQCIRDCATSPWVCPDDNCGIFGLCR